MRTRSLLRLAVMCLIAVEVSPAHGESNTRYQLQVGVGELLQFPPDEVNRDGAIYLTELPLSFQLGKAVGRTVLGAGATLGYARAHRIAYDYVTYGAQLFADICLAGSCVVRLQGQLGLRGFYSNIGGYNPEGSIISAALAYQPGDDGRGFGVMARTTYYHLSDGGPDGDRLRIPALGLAVLMTLSWR